MHTLTKTVITGNTDGQLHAQKARREHSPTTSNGSGGLCEGVPSERIVVVQFSVVDAAQDTRIRLFALRNVMHRMLNAAISEWHRAGKKPSVKDSTKETLDRGSVTEVVQGVLARERAYWETQLPALRAAEEKVRMKLGRARAEDRKRTELEENLRKVRRDLEFVEARSSISPPSAIYDSVVYFTGSKYRQYKKAEFRGERTLDTFRDGQPIRWRDGAWTIALADKKGIYRLRLPLHTSGGRVERHTVTIRPDGPSMFGFAAQMVDADLLRENRVKQCDARLVYSEKKKEWFAKLTMRLSYTQPVAGKGVAAMRRGVANAFVLAFEDGTCEPITGADVIAFKAQMKARRESVGRHLRSLELGSGARGHGKKRRYLALHRLDDVEARFVDSRCKRWAAGIVRLLVSSGVGRLIVSDFNAKEFFDSVANEELAAFLRRWPFAKAMTAIEQACELAGITVERKEVGFNTRRCPRCLHMHEARQSGVFACEVCEEKRPADWILALNMLRDCVGEAPIKKGAEARKKLEKELRGRKEKDDK